MATLVIFALIATVISLFWGIGSMAVGGRFDEEHSGQFMKARVVLQVLAVVLLIGAAFMNIH